MTPLVLEYSVEWSINDIFEIFFYLQNLDFTKWESMCDVVFPFVEHLNGRQRSILTGKKLVLRIDLYENFTKITAVLLIYWHLTYIRYLIIN